MISYIELRKNEEINTYIAAQDESLSALGYTEHSFAHVTKVALLAADILTALGHSERTAELARIAGYLHDIGNLVNRHGHSESGALIAFRLLDKLGMEPTEIAVITTAIGNHDEGTGVPVSHVAAALILADKADVRRSRVRNSDFSTFDIHDRVNYSVEESSLEISENKESICLSLKIDTKISTVMDYFEIFLDRMILCRKAAEKLGLAFKLNINGQELL
ncbi:MAG: HD domain-containing protein [Clostridia bacterium]|nr:HD domain-containing protein [Clostridia bacterium]